MSTTPCPLVTALAKVQGKLTTIPKNKTVTVQTRGGQSYGFKYADLDAIMGAIRPLLAEEGLSIIQSAQFVEGFGWVLKTEIAHPDTDHTVAGMTPILWAQSADPKAFGSGQTYARRYGLCALLGIVSDEDDDGQMAGRKPKADAQERAQARRRQEGDTGATGKPGAGLEEALRSAKTSGFDTGGFVAAQAKEHGLLDDQGKARRDLFDVVTAEQAAAMLDALGKARTEAMREAAT